MLTAYNANITNHCTHDVPCSDGSNTHNYWAIDLFDSYADPSPVYATSAGYVLGVDACGTSLTLGTHTSGSGWGYLYCHGKNRAIGVGGFVSQGVRIMDMSNSGTVAKHLHFEIRWMSNVSSWSSNFYGFCSNRYLMSIRDSGYVYLQSAWAEPSKTYYSACSWTGAA